MIRPDRRRQWCRLLLVLILTFIWGNSLLPARLSLALSDSVKHLLAAVFPASGSVATGSGMLRKLAHFLEFAALGMTLTGLCGLHRRGLCRSAVLGVAAACIDETLQCFAPGRGPGVKDVLLDSAGVLTGIALVLLGHTIRVRYQTRNRRTF